jgi:hypothetical protein
MQYVVPLLKDTLPALAEAAEKTPLTGAQKAELVMKNLLDHVAMMEGIKDDATRKQVVELISALAPTAIELVCRASKGLYALNKRECKCGCVIN